VTPQVSTYMHDIIYSCRVTSLVITQLIVQLAIYAANNAPGCLLVSRHKNEESYELIVRHESDTQLEEGRKQRPTACTTAAANARAPLPGASPRLDSQPMRAPAGCTGLGLVASRAFLMLALRVTTYSW